MILSEPEHVSTYVDDGGAVTAIEPPAGSFLVAGPVVVPIEL